MFHLLDYYILYVSFMILMIIMFGKP